MQAIKAKKPTFKHIEAEWYNYHHTLKEIARLREEIMNPFDEYPEDVNIVKGANSVRKPGDPTERIASRLSTNKQLKYLNEIAEAIGQVYNALPSDCKELVQVKYWGNRRLTWDRIASEINMSRSTAIRRRDEIIYATIELLGWR